MMLLTRTTHCAAWISASLSNGKRFCTVLSILCLFALLGNSRLMNFTETMRKPSLSERVYEWSISYRNTLLNSEWITKFPELEAMVKYIVSQPQFPLFSETTDPSVTRFVAQENDPVVGNKWKALIYAKDFHHNPKSYGGDYFRVVLHRTAVPGDGLCCHIIDNLNGTYSVTCELPWLGQAKIEATLIHPSESVFYLMTNTSSKKSGVGYTTTFVSSSGKKEASNCALSFDVEYSIAQLCNYSHPRNGEPWFCVKPPSGECNPIIWQVNTIDVNIIPDVGHNPYFDTKVNLRREISGSGITFEVTNRKKDAFEKRNITSDGPCEAPSRPPMSPSKSTGWIHNGNWESFICKNDQFNVEKIAKCLQHHVIYFLGDSTIRLWYEDLRNYLGAKDVSPRMASNVWSRSRKGVDDKRNITLYYRSHGPPLRNPGPPISRPYMTDSIEEIKTAGKETIIFFSIGFHFEVFDPDVFLSRVRVIKRGLIKLLNRLPHVRVFVKGFHTHTETKAVIPSDWLSYRFDVLLRQEFSDISAIVFLNMWDISSALNNNLIHPKGKEQLQYSGLFQSYVCPPM